MVNESSNNDLIVLSKNKYRENLSIYNQLGLIVINSKETRGGHT